VSTISIKRLEFVRAPGDTLVTNAVVLDVDGPKYAIDMRWRPVAASWFLTLRLTSGTVIVSGAPVRDRTDCLLGVTPPPGFTRPRGGIMSYDPKARGEPTLTSYFADDVRLYYVPAGLNPADFAVYQSEVV
jgi:hypothetical protein